MKSESPVKIWRKQKTIYKFLGKTGRVISWTKIHTPPADFAEEAPYFVVFVAMDKAKAHHHNDVSLRIGQLVDYESKIKKGMRVKLVYRRIAKASEEGVINYGLKFKALGSQ